MLHNADEVNKVLGPEPRTEHRVRYGKGVTIVVMVPLGGLQDVQEAFFGELSLQTRLQIPGMPFPLVMETVKWVPLTGKNIEEAAADWDSRSVAALQEFQREMMGLKIVLPNG